MVKRRRGGKGDKCDKKNFFVTLVRIFSIFAALILLLCMKYSELEKKLRKVGCYPIGNNDHPIWYSPITGNKFKTGHHKSQEVKAGTLLAICKAAGITI